MTHRDTRCTFIAAMLLAASGGCGSIVLVEAGDDSTGPGVGTTTDPSVGTTTDPSVGTSGPSSGAPLPSTSATTATPTTSPPGTTTGVGVGTSSGGDEESSGGPGGCGGAGGFICIPDGGLPGDPCSVWDQDCPDGEKCAPWANDGGSTWNATRCSPIDPDPDAVGESCTVEGSGVSGIDSCALGSICWDVDPQTSAGTCVPQCIGSEQEPACADENRTCRIYAEGVLTLCFAQCNPLESDTCPATQGCYPVDQGFMCAPDASGDEGGLFEPCEFINGCDPGLACADAGDLEACAGSLSCCTPFCDLDAPDCPMSSSCTPLFGPGEVPDDLLNVGLCT